MKYTVYVTVTDNATGDELDRYTIELYSDRQGNNLDDQVRCDVENKWVAGVCYSWSTEGQPIMPKRKKLLGIF